MRTIHTIAHSEPTHLHKIHLVILVAKFTIVVVDEPGAYQTDNSVVARLFREQSSQELLYRRRKHRVKILRCCVWVVGDVICGLHGLRGEVNTCGGVGWGEVNTCGGVGWGANTQRATKAQRSAAQRGTDRCSVARDNYERRTLPSLDLKLCMLEWLMFG